MSNFQDVKSLHLHFQLPQEETPQFLSPEDYAFRLKFMVEELDEFMLAHAVGDLPDAADSLIDLVYVAMGTAVMMGLPWEEMWDEVHRANMKKVLVESAAESKRGSAIDLKKPDGWVPPDIKAIINRRLTDAN